MENKINFSKDEVLKTIFPYIKDKEVLDIGCVEHSLENKNKKRIWVHGFLRTYSKKVTGIDIMEEDVKILRSEGYDVHYMSAESFNFNKKFDIIFAGELIEHLSNPGLFLEQCKRHLKKGGYLIITTPNAFSYYRFLSIIKNFSNDPVTNKEHTMWFSPSGIREMLKRKKFEVKKMFFIRYPQLNPKLGHRIIYFLETVFGNKFNETMVVISK